jgi:hypothetical protein
MCTYVVLIDLGTTFFCHIYISINYDRTHDNNTNFNMIAFFRFANKRASYPFRIISLVHAQVNVTDFSIGSVPCNPTNADRGRSIIRGT